MKTIFSIQGASTLFASVALFVVMPASSWADDFAFRPGHVYAATSNGIREYTPELAPVAFRPIPELFNSGAQGGVFNANGNFVFDGFLGGFEGGSTIVEVNESGDILRQRRLHRWFLWSSELELDGAGNYIIAADNRFLVISPSFELVTSLSQPTVRASAVTIAPDGRIFAADQLGGRIDIYSPNYEFERSLPIGSVNGMDFSLDGQLYYSEPGRVFRLDVETGRSTLIYTLPSGSPGSIDFSPDGTYYLSVSNSVLQHRSATHQLLGEIIVPSDFDGVAIYVPTPSLLLPGIAALFWHGGRRRRDSLVQSSSARRA